MKQKKIDSDLDDKVWKETVCCQASVLPSSAYKYLEAASATVRFSRSVPKLKPAQ